MTEADRKLLEAAARAAGIKIHAWRYDECAFVGDGESGAYECWNPLTNDGDALRLAVKLELQLDLRRGLPGADPEDATRRAIVRAAASLAHEPTE